MIEKIIKLKQIQQQQDFFTKKNSCRFYNIRETDKCLKTIRTNKLIL